MANRFAARQTKVRLSLDCLRALPQLAAVDRRRKAREQAPAPSHSTVRLSSVLGSLEAIPSEPPSLARQSSGATAAERGWRPIPLVSLSPLRRWLAQTRQVATDARIE